MPGDAKIGEGASVCVPGIHSQRAMVEHLPIRAGAETTPTLRGDDDSASRKKVGCGKDAETRSGISDRNVSIQ